MNSCAPEPADDPFAVLALPAAVHRQALLAGIIHARTVADTLYATDRAEGFTLGIETVRALNLGAIEGLYILFDRASRARQAELRE